MSINLIGLKEVLDSTKIPYWRDKAPKNTEYPYIIYSFVSEDTKVASGKIFHTLPLYQVSLFTIGTEKDFRPILYAFSKAGVPTSSVMSVAGDENDDTVTNFFIKVRLVESGE